MTAQLTMKEWLEYVNRLQERERQKITSTGLSNWTLFAALAALGYWILPEIPKIQQSYFLTSFGVVFFHNLSITLFDIFNNYYRQDKILKFRSPSNKLDQVGTMPLVWLERLTLIFAFVLNILVMIKCIHSGYYLFIPYFLLYLIRYFTNISHNIVFDLINRGYLKSFAIKVQETRTKIESEKASDGSKKTGFWQMVFSEFFYLIITISLSVYIFLNITLESQSLKLFLDGLAITLFLILLQFLFMIFYKRMKIAWLEKLERDIIQNNLNQRAVIQRLSEGYFNLSRIDDYF